MHSTKLLLVAALALLLSSGCGGCDDQGDPSNNMGSDAGNTGPDATIDASGRSGPCDPNPCAEDGRTTCTVVDDTAQCSCTPGFDPVGEDCVAVVECPPNPCSERGTCRVEDGAYVCDCLVGYAGEDCETCDQANGYHDDGNGECTADPCTPNPCQDPNQNACRAEGQAAVCECDPGFHD
jgi:hypothetical protein